MELTCVRPRRALGLLLAVLVLFISGQCRAETLSAENVKYLAKYGITYSLVTKTEPRALRIHQLKIDLKNPRIEMASVLGKDPDGDGPAETSLEAPATLIDRCGGLAFVNANRWQGMPDPEGKRSTDWTLNMPVDMQGLAVSEGEVRSPAENDYCAFWVDDKGAPHIGNPEAGAKVRAAVAGFTRLVKDGQIVQPDDPAIHPRTALGLDAENRYLYLVVVDGRQPGYSEGMTTPELAQYMLALGCANAVNLDGGGSSVMLVTDAKTRQYVLNDPSTKVYGMSIARPIPSGLVIRAKKK